MQACHWKAHNTFTNFYLKDLTWSDDMLYLGPVVAAQQVLDPSPQTRYPQKEKKGGHIHYNQVFRSLIPGSRYLFTSQDAMGKVGPRWQSGNTLASHLCGRGSIPVMAVSGKADSCLPLVGSLQYTTLANYMYWFPLPFQLPVVI